jgi:hypothetical protein
MKKINLTKEMIFEINDENLKAEWTRVSDDD